jgi:hypothetical protein
MVVEGIKLATKIWGLGIAGRVGESQCDHAAVISLLVYIAAGYDNIFQTVQTDQ